MIVCETGASLLLMTQPDHAALSRRIMERWIAGGFAQALRRASILHAIEQHDNGWQELDAAPIVDESSGRIADFISAPADARRALWPRGALRLAHDPWAAALVAQHAIHIYARYRDDPEWRRFFDEMETLRTRFASAAGESLDTLLSDYVYLRVGDLISLAYCNRWTDEQRDVGHAILCGDSSVVITPDPFAGASFPIEMRARELPNRAFRNAADADTEWRRARDVVLQGTVSGGRTAGLNPARPT